MKTKHISALIRDDLTTVAVFFPADAGQPGMGLKHYVYKILKEDVVNVKKDDLVVVLSRDGKQYTVAQISEVHEFPQIDPDFEGDYKWVIAAVSLDRYNAIKAHEVEMNSTILAAEREVKRKSVLDLYTKVIGATPSLAGRFNELKKGVALAAPAVKTEFPKE